MATLYIPELRMTVTVSDDADVTEVRNRYMRKKVIRKPCTASILAHRKQYNKAYKSRNKDIAALTETHSDKFRGNGSIH